MEQPSYYIKAFQGTGDPDRVADDPSDFRDLVEVIL